MKFHEVTYVNEQKKDKIKHQNQSFLSRSQRGNQQSDRILTPYPGYYENRLTMEYNSVSKLLKGSSGGTFVTKEKRFKNSY